MPPGNSNNKGSVPVVCSYCGSKNCSGESRHFHSFRTSNASRDDRVSGLSFPDRVQRIAPVQISVNQRSSEQPRGLNSPRDSACGLTTQKTPSIDQEVKSRDIGSTAESKEEISNHQEVKSRNFGSTAESKEEILKKGSKEQRDISIKSSSNVKPNTVPLDQLTQSGAVAGLTPAVVKNSNSLSLSKNEDVSQTGVAHSSQLNVGESSLFQNNEKDILKNENVNLTGNKASYTIPQTQNKIVVSPNTSSRIDDPVCVNKAIPEVNPNHTYEEKKSSGISKENSNNENYTSNSLQIDVNKNETSPLTGNSQNRVVEPGLLDSTSKSQSSENNVPKVTRKKHSPNATIHNGVVLKVIDSRTAMLQVGDADTEPRFAELFVDNLLPSRNEPPYKVNTNIKSVLSIGDKLTLVCTNHVKKTSMYQLFAHEAWKTESGSCNDNQSNNIDKESVISFTSQSSAPLSEQKENKRRIRRKKLHEEKMREYNPNDVNDAVSQWLDQNECSRPNKNETLVEGYEYNGLVTDLKLPYLFTIEVSLKEGVESISAKAIDFHPEGPHSTSLPYNVPLQGWLNVGDRVCVIPTKEGKTGWQAKKVWLKERNLEPHPFAINGIHSRVDTMLGRNGNFMELQDKKIVFTGSGTDVDGVILSLQTTWGLVKHMQRLSTYVFNRKNTYLFGISLKNCVLDDVLREGQVVKFSLEDGEYGLNANKLWYGETYPSFYSWQRGLRDYCDTYEIKHNIENCLVKLGESLFR